MPKVMIAIAIANQPRLLIADEPTNAMEPATQTQIFRLLTRLNQNNNMTILLISHDLQWMSKLASKITVMYCGQTVETAIPEELLVTPIILIHKPLSALFLILLTLCLIKAV